MRASLILAAPFVALALAQSGETNVTEVTTSSSSYVYTNPLTAYLTQTNSLGVITGMPPVETSVGNAGTAVTTQAIVVTSQPAVALVPAGFTGVTTLKFGGNGTSATSSIVITAGTGTTFIVSATSAAATSGAGASGSASGSGATSGASGTAASGGSSGTAGSGTATGSAATSSSSTGAAAHIYVASSALIGAGALFAAFL